MSPHVMRWLVGLGIAAGRGYVVTGSFLWFVRNQLLKLGDKPGSLEKKDRVPPWFTGITERIVFALFVGTNAPSVPPSRMTWLAVKLATNWNSQLWQGDTRARTFALTALLAGLVSMGCAYIGGLIAAGKI